MIRLRNKFRVTNPRIAFKAIRELGLTAVSLNALYKLGLKTGYFRFLERRPLTIEQPLPTVNGLFPLPSRASLLAALGPAGLEQLTAEADEVVAGKYRPFGGEPVEIDLQAPSPQTHWSRLESHHQPSTFDIKLIWEPARFGWAFTLGRAYQATSDEKYAAAFWRYFEIFQAANPPYWGENWMSGQEVGIRLMAFTWAGQVFRQAEQTTPSRLAGLAASIGIHAARIPATLLYARSQNNNHLLTEAAALYTAALALPEHPQAAAWRKTGLRWLNWCFENQIDETGEYIQHSTNYHRLMLQTALWVSGIRCQVSGTPLTPDASLLTPRSRENLARATRWLLSLLDPASGGAPNLGANDGAYIFPLSSLPFKDFRPVSHAAAQAFLGYTPPAGPWDEMPLWFGLPRSESLREISPYSSGDHIYAPNSWGYLRAARYQSRPSHADQLHFDLWWRGLNIAQDAGTYSYNAPLPWDNSLTSTLVHNTVTVNGREQMTRVSRFLYLDWANASAQEHPQNGENFLRRVSAQTEAYARLGIRHTRTVTVYPDERWRVEDELLNRGQEPRAYRLHWLLPDWEVDIRDSIVDSRDSIVDSRDSVVEIWVKSPLGWVTLKIDIQPANLQPSTSMVRAGEVAWGMLTDCPPTRGWVSPTYSVKNPALSLAVEVQSAETVRFTTEFTFPTVRRNSFRA